MWRFVSAARMAQIKADARAEGYIKAVREGLAANDAAKEDRIVTSETTQTANTSVQEAVHDMHKRVDAAQKQVAAGKKRRSRFKNLRSSYADPSLKLIANAAIVEDYVFKNIGKLTQTQMAKYIVRNMGTHVKGHAGPIKVTNTFISQLLNRRRVYDEGTNTVVNVYSRNKNR